MNVIDRARVSWATFSYDLWLELRGVPGRRRRDLRRELRSNLGDATAAVGSRNAVRALGNMRQMAAAAADESDPTRPRWTIGFVVGLAALAVSWTTGIFAALSWLDGVIAAEPDGQVSGAMTFFPGSSLIYEPLAEGFSFTMNLGWVCFLIGLIAFVLAARPWRVFVRSAAASAV
jgi:hypothetical protein